MYIHRVVLKGVPGIPDRDLTFFDEWAEKPITSVLLTGPNGTGKTAILRTITSLWDYLGSVFTHAASTFEFYVHTMHWAGLVAIEIRDLAQYPPIWVFAAHDSHRADVKKLAGSDVAIGNYRAENGGIIEESIEVPDWFGELSDVVQKSQLGAAGIGEQLPNMVFVEANNRQIKPYNPVRVSSGNRTPAIRPEPLYLWLTTYDQQYRDEPLEIKLRNLKIRDEHWFQATLESMNRFLQQNGKSLVGFDDFLRMRVSNSHQDRPHYITDLSSGEQQCLVLIYMVSRWLMKGGVVLIDEPDLHLHGSWQRSLIHELERLVAEKNGQLIVTSHSSLVVEEYREAQRFHLEGETQHT